MTTKEKEIDYDILVYDLKDCAKQLIHRHGVEKADEAFRELYVFVMSEANKIK